MATKKTASSAAKKRSIARRFNDSLEGRRSRSASAKNLDRRTAKRLNRYREELKKSRKAGDKDLTALDIAMRINELLKHGERITAIKKLIKPRSVEYMDQDLVALLKEMHPIYKFLPQAYHFAGVTNETLVAAGILQSLPARRGPVPGSKQAGKRGPAKKKGVKKGKKK